MKKEDTIEQVLEMVNKFALEKKGSLFVITNNTNIHKYYERLYPDLFSNKDINLKCKETRILLSVLTDLDGAIIITEEGKIIDYGAKLKPTAGIFPGHGTRHYAALGITKIPNTMSILSSEEDGQVRIFKNKNLVAEINPKNGKNTKFFYRLANLFSKSEILVATSGGVTSLLIGINPILAGLVFTGSYVITKYGVASIKDFIDTGKIIIKENKK